MHYSEKLEKLFEGHEIVDVEIESHDRFFLLGVELDEDGDLGGDYRMCSVNRDGGDWIIKDVELKNFNCLAQMGMSFEQEPRIIVSSINGGAWVSSIGIEPLIKPRREGGPLAGALTRIKSLGGPAIACTSNRGVMIRKGKESWQTLGPEIPLDQKSIELGFSDFDGFSEVDIYAVGGHKDVWHFDGTEWLQYRFPISRGLSAVCCGGDGQVYIGTEGSSVFSGKESKWKQVHHDQYACGIKDIVWFEDKAWATHDLGLWTGRGDLFTTAEVPNEVGACRGNLAVRGDTLVLAGTCGAALYRDGQWEVLFNRAAPS